MKKKQYVKDMGCYIVTRHNNKNYYYTMIPAIVCDEFSITDKTRFKVSIERPNKIIYEKIKDEMSEPLQEM